MYRLIITQHPTMSPLILSKELLIRGAKTNVRRASSKRAKFH